MTVEVERRGGAEIHEATQSGSLVRPASTPTVLVIDDNEGNRALAQGALEDESYRVITATSGVAGIEAFERETVDCILLDVRMPGLDGFGVCERIRKLPRGPETPIIFLTAQRDVDTFDQAQRAGGDDFLTKPVRPNELVARVHAALRLRQARTDLAEHYELLKRQRDDLMRLQLQKERLSAFVVHDLKNPVNAMDLYAQLIQRDGSLSADARESAGQIRAEARHLNRLIMNLLDLSKADEGKLTAQHVPTDLRAMVGALVNEFEPSAEGRGARLESDLAVDEVVGDPDLLHRLIANLVDNAIRHAPRGTAVVVSTRLEDAAVVIGVRDFGTGIPVALRDRIFDPFMQVGGEGLSHRTGRGLGLAFCRIAAEAHHGRVWVDDATPGAVFKVRIPNGH
ncbi:MAG: hybrid sensor histidine kinase/response regulator [Polyangiaceae bacterium]